jgi:type IV pilus assembly protein PilZ
MPSTSNRRQEERAPIVLKVEYKRLNTFFYDYTKNISKGGIFIKTKKPLPVGTGFLFKLFVPGLADPLSLRGEVRWITAGPGAPKVPPEGHPDDEAGMGIRLVYGGDDERQEVERIVTKLMVGSLGALIHAHLKNEGDDPDRWG